VSCDCPLSRVSACRWIAARKHYCRHVEAKLQQRADLRVVGRALQAWAEHTERQRAVQARLRAAVRRMYLVRLYHTFTGWLVCCTPWVALWPAFL
jgi:hypothetical protein